MRNIKTILILIFIVGFSFVTKSYAITGKKLNETIEKEVKFKSGFLSFEENNAAFVKISFRITQEGTLEVLAINYSNEKIKSQLIDKLSKIKVDGDYDYKKIYNYNFSFKKV